MAGMSFGLVQLAAFLVAIGVLVAAHEFGHFWVARRLGFKVLKFSIGFGRAIASRRGRDGVEYVIGMIPLGGYVKLADEREAPVAEADAPRAFNRRPVWQRVLVLVAGAGANFLFAIVAFWILFMSGMPGLRPVIGEVKAGSFAAAAGLRTGDEIVAVGERPVATREAAVLEMLSAIVDGGRVELKLARAGGTALATVTVPDERRRALTEPGAWSDGLGLAFTRPFVPAIVGKVVEGGAAAAAGLVAGDQILAVDGRRVADFFELRNAIAGRPGAAVSLEVRRGERTLTVPATVHGERDANEPGQPIVGRLGIQPGGQASFPPAMHTLERYGPLDAIRPALAETWSKTAVTVKFLWRMVTGDVSLKNVSGPISIAAYAGVSALEGATAFLSFLAIISISLGVLNLLPIPILDGGQVVYQLAEGIKGSPLSERLQVAGQQVGIVLLVLLMSLAIYNDLARLS
jgi:regulator of sigma E protease